MALLRYIFSLVLILLVPDVECFAQTRYEISGDWLFVKASDVNMSGKEISNIQKRLAGALPAVVPGTVLTSLLHNKRIPDPFYGMNNKLIPDIYNVGRDYYTYWFIKDFDEPAIKGQSLFIYLRGVNYGYDIYLNGNKVNKDTAKGMFMGRRFNITSHLKTNGQNRIAIIVYPPSPVGIPNGGQGGDGTIAQNVANQYVAGWDWIQPIRDRNTGIWDKVFIEKVGAARIENVKVVTHVPGKRISGDGQANAIISVEADLQNLANLPFHGFVKYTVEGNEVSLPVVLKEGESRRVKLPDYVLKQPKLWWPNGIGDQPMYDIKVRFQQEGGAIADEQVLKVGVREITTRWNTNTASREIYVNGQRIFIKGANRILQDAMLRFSSQSYDAEVRYHRDMNLNMIRVWGGGITERPEFYDACDKYGILVMQDFWMTGDCNGRWNDTYKKDDTDIRRQYPADHSLWLASCANQIEMLRNHASLAIWCGGNEIRPPQGVLSVLRDSILPALDGTRYFFEYSNDDSMSLHAHDGPYTIQKDNYFWEHRSYGFNSEIGSVGIGDRESLARFMPAVNMVPPYYDTAAQKWVVDAVWQYHKYSSYDSAVTAYGSIKDADDFLWKAQLVNYNQYRALMEGIRSRMWGWYTGVLIWKTQNPWTAMVGQMYDVYLDPNACLYGTQAGAKPLHIMYNQTTKSAMVVNDNHFPVNDCQFRYSIFKESTMFSVVTDGGGFTLHADTCIELGAINLEASKEVLEEGAFLQLELIGKGNKVIDKNLYWLPDANGSYEWLSHIETVPLPVSAIFTGKGRVAVTLDNTKGNKLSFFNHVSVVDAKTKKRIVPCFSDINYISILWGAKETVILEFQEPNEATFLVCVEGWNGKKQLVDIKR